MPALAPTEFFGKIIWLGAVMSRPAIEIETEACSSLDLTWEGVAGAAHTGRTRPSDSRVLAQHARGTEIANVRQISLVGAEDLAHIAQALDLPSIDPKWLGANAVVEGLPDFSHLPPSSRLQFENGTTLIVDMQNFPCQQVSRTIELDRPGHGKAFKMHAAGRRGVTAWIERPGRITVGDVLRLHAPSQRGWEPGTGKLF